MQNDREWTVLCRDVLRRPELAEDARFRANTDRVDHNDELTVIIEQAFAEHTADEVIELLERAGIANARLRTPAELVHHPQLDARERWRLVDTPGGAMCALLPPAVADRWESTMGAVPELGRHNAAIRAEFTVRKEVRA